MTDKAEELRIQLAHMKGTLDGVNAKRKRVETELEELKTRIAEALKPTKERDRCMFCNGTKGGVPGNENVVGNVVMCDYCTTLYIDARNAEAEMRRKAGA